jgi:hypothetical protein
MVQDSNVGKVNSEVQNIILGDLISFLSSGIAAYYFT